MKRFCFLIFILGTFNITINAQDVKVIRYEQLEEMISSSKGLTVFNFWATWCRPCVAELPHFNEVAKSHNKDVTIVLVSLDFADKVEKRVKPFLKRKQFDMQCVLLDESDGERWIAKVNEKWDGAIPASLVVHNEKGIREFYDGEISKEELEGIVAQFR